MHVELHWVPSGECQAFGCKGLDVAGFKKACARLGTPVRGSTFWARKEGHGSLTRAGIAERMSDKHVGEFSEGSSSRAGDAGVPCGAPTLVQDGLRYEECEAMM